MNVPIVIPPPVASLPDALRDPRAYPHFVDEVQLIETHISWVFLAGDYAYKVKKPLALPFLDYGTLARRERCCREELRLNRRTAPEVYLDVVAIAGTPPRVGGEGAVREWAVRMRRFPQAALLDALATAHSLQPWHVDAFAAAVAQFHEVAARDEPGSAFGTPAAVTAPALANFDEIAAFGAPPGSEEALAVLRAWTEREAARLAPRFAGRKAEGRVRECHGDLHLGNAFLSGAAVRLFDAIEFDPRLRWTDTMDDVAFAYMDLIAHGLPRMAYRFLDAWLERSGDFEGLDVLRYYAVYRALVRCKVACLRRRDAADEATGREATQRFERYLLLAARLALREPPVLVLMHGASASGKTVGSQRLLEALGAIRLRSDVERKRLQGLPPTARAYAAPGEGAYSPARTDATYARLEQLARRVLAAGYPVVVDATFLDRARREPFAALARESGAAFQILCCRAPADVLRGRIERRLMKGDDASDAGIDVLERQLAGLQPLGADEQVHQTVLDTTTASAWAGALESFARRFRMPMEEAA